MLSKGNLNFSYDRDNRLIDVSGGASASYGYNALHQRTSKTVSGQTTYYIYDALGQLLAELDANGQTQVEYIWLENQPLAVIHANTSNADIYYIHNNHLNTPQVISDAQGDSVWQADYSPFGQASVSASSTITFNLRFPGQYFDAETGLHYNYYRIYDPATGRYIQSDPIGLEGGLNTYAYVTGNPIMLYDPYGLWAWAGPRDIYNFWNETVGAGRDFIQNYQDMKNANTIGADKYFHCKANCEAAQRGVAGADTACVISNSREWFDQTIKGDSAFESEADQIANHYGREQGQLNKKDSCVSLCAPFRPNGLSSQY